MGQYNLKQLMAAAGCFAIACGATFSLVVPAASREFDERLNEPLLIIGAIVAGLALSSIPWLFDYNLYVPLAMLLGSYFVFSGLKYQLIFPALMGVFMVVQAALFFWLKRRMLATKALDSYKSADPP